MSHTDTPIQPIPVHVANAGDIWSAAAEPRRRRIRSTFRTFVLTATNPIIPILAEDLSRRAADLQAIGNSIVICESQSQAQDPSNAVAGLPNPQGLLLFVPAAASAENTGTQTDPGPGTLITSVALAPGTWVVNVTSMLPGGGAAADTNNIGIYQGATLIYTPELDPFITSPQPAVPIEIQVPAAGAVISAKAIGAASGAAIIYDSTIVASQASTAATSARWPLDTNDVTWASAAYLTGTATATLAMTWRNEARGY